MLCNQNYRPINFVLKILKFSEIDEKYRLDCFMILASHDGDMILNEIVYI